MKIRKITLLALSAVVGILACLSDATAQSRLQIIHNAAAVSLDSVDIYVDDTKIENVNFRRATGLLSLTAGAHIINVNDRNSADSGDMVLARFAVLLVNNQSHIAIINGVDDTLNYAANPDGRSTDLQLLFRANTNLSPANNAQTVLNIVHGTTDAAGLDLYTRPNTLLLNNVRYGDVSANTFVSSVSTSIDVRDSNGINVINTYIAPLQSYAKKSLVVFSSGFMDVAGNQNGQSFGLYAVDTAGGDAMALVATARMQIVHNSPDYIIDSVDVWANDTKIIDDLPFRKASTFFNIPPGNYDITIAKKNSVDTSSAVTLYRAVNYLVEGGKTYIGLVSGVVDTLQYAANPDGIDRSFTLVSASNYKEGTESGKVELSFYNGTPDAPEIDVNGFLSSGSTKIANDISYKSVSPASQLNAGNSIVTITSADSTIFWGAYQLNTTSFSGRAGMLFTSGVYSATGNPAEAKPVSMFVVFSDGTVVELMKLSAGVQIVHNSADVSLDSVDVYVNGIKSIDNFAFRTATSFLPFNANVPYSIAIAPKNSLSVADSIYSTTLALDSSTNYYIIANGVMNTAGYVANPNGKNIGFQLYTYKGARKQASIAKNVDLLYFHGATDLRKTTIKGDHQVQYLSKDDAYGDFHGYAIHSAIDNILMRVTDATALDTVLYSGFANLASYQGVAGLVLASGFDNADSVTNHDGDSLMLFIVWPDGNVDSIVPPPQPNTGINEQILTLGSLSVYPNPSNGNAAITLQANTNTISDIVLVDITGRVVYADTWKMVAGVNRYEMNLGTVNNGLYFLNITSSDKQQMTYKIIVSK